jgi:hypothetical protein
MRQGFCFLIFWSLLLTDKYFQKLVNLQEVLCSFSLFLKGVTAKNNAMKVHFTFKQINDNYINRCIYI